MNDQIFEKIISLDDIDFADFWGTNEKNLEFIKLLFPKVRLIARGEMLKIVGNEDDALFFEAKLKDMLHYYEHNGRIDSESIVQIMEGTVNQENAGSDVLVHGRNGLLVKARTPNQKRLVEAVKENDMVFAIGPAGTGKTYTAVALAVRALKNKEVKRIVLCRPAVEAGEKLGFLPGDMREKIDPFLQPLYDALQDMIPSAKLKEYMDFNIIQIAPLAFMRGRTLNDAVVILDEAQNTTPQQIKMFLTRMGWNTKMIVTGDLTQIDLPPTQISGLVQALEVLDGVEGLSIIRMTKKDIVRHKLVTRIVDAYDKYDQTHKNEKRILKNNSNEQSTDRN